MTAPATASATHAYRTVDVPVSGGDLHVGIWDPIDAPADAPTVLLVHGVTSSHLAWPFVVAQLPGVRAIAPDLRGRGRSNRLEGPAGMAAHADDLAAMLRTIDPAGPLGPVVVVGHSMGGFVAAVFAHRHPEAVSRLVLVDGGLPLDAPTGLAPEDLVQAILGPTADRLSQRWSGVEEYRGFWDHHPAFQGSASPELDAYVAYDLVPTDDGEAFRPATSLQTTVDDTVDLNLGTALPEALRALAHPTLFLTVPRGLLDETPGLYPPAHLARMMPAFPGIRHVELGDLNHYTVVMSAPGAAALAPHLRAEIAAA